MNNSHRSLHLLVFSLLILTVVLSVATADNIEAFLTPEALLEAWDAEYGGITTFRISFAEELHGIISETGEKINNDDGILEYQQVQMTKDKRNGRYHAKLTYQKGGFSDLGATQEFAYDGKVTRQHYGRMSLSAFIKPGLTNDAIPSLDMVFEKYLLLKKRKSNISKDKYPDGLHMAAWLLENMERMKPRVRPNLEVVNGHRCHVLEVILDNDSSIRVWLAHGKNMVPMKYEEIAFGITTDRLEVFKLASAQSDTGKVWFPSEVSYTEYFESGRGRKGQPRYITYTAHIAEFVPNIPVTRDDFSFEFASGTRVTDLIANLNYTVGVGKIDKPVDDVIPMESLEKDDPNDHPLPYAERPVPKEHTKQTQLNNNSTAQELPKQPAKLNTPSITSQQTTFALLLLLGILLVSAAIYFRSARRNKT